MAPMSVELFDLRTDTEQLLAKYPASYSPDQVDAFTALRRFAIERTSHHEVPSVIFVCVHNAGRSQMSAGFARHLAGSNLTVFSGGSNPAAVVNSVAIEAMAEVGIDIAGQFPVPFTEEIVKASDVVVTMGCGDACPYFPGKRYIDWVLDDPHDQDLQTVRLVRDEIERLVGRLLGELGIGVIQ